MSGKPARFHESFILMCALLICGAGAGLPEDDSVSARLQREFRSAHKPTHEELQTKKTWYCNERPAFRGSSVGVENGVYFKFSRQGKGAAYEKAGGDVMYKNKILPSWRAFRILHMKDSALMGYGSLGLDPIENTNRMYFIRASGTTAADAKLLVESTARSSVLKNPEKDYPKAISTDSEGNELRATTYSECRTEMPVTPSRSSAATASR